jgi:transposase InsO family protein
VNERYQRIAALEKEFALSDLCAALAVSRSGYYAWRERAPSPRQVANGRLLEQIQDLRQGAEAAYGSPRLTVELNSRGHPCSENRVARLMRRHGLRALSASALRAPHHRQRPR